LRGGFTLIELLIVIAVIAILASIAIPWLLSARMSAHEASAISSLQAINDAQALYRDTCGKGRYAPNLPVLGVPAPSTGVAFLSPDLTGGDVVVKSGYQVTMGGAPGEFPPVSCNGSETTAGYFATADPTRPGNSGTRFFGTNSTRVIYEGVQSFAGKMPEDGAPEGGTELK
jgi:prepilin-type N-terminal cleavage/methylation domain-containing protein